MKKIIVLLCVSLFAGCASGPGPVRRLSPQMSGGTVPAECKIVSVLKDTPAQKAGLQVGDRIVSVNGPKPESATAVAELISKAPADSVLGVVDSTGAERQLKVRLNDAKPRLGAVCDLTGWEKPGITPAGNESMTVFNGPFVLTTSGIVDKGLVFARVRLTNDTDHPVVIGPEVITVKDPNGQPLTLYSPKDVMCYLYGAKGAHLLSLKRQKKSSVDADTAPGTTPDDTCPNGQVKGKFSGTADAQYAEANAEYVASESLWPYTYQPGTTADGLIYLLEPPALPMTIEATLEGRTLVTKLGKPVPSQKQMKVSEIASFFEKQKRGAPIRLTLKKGKVFVGRLMSYDAENERAWFEAPSGSLLNQVSYPITSVQSAELLEQLPGK